MVKVNNVELQNMTYNDAEVTSWIHDGVEVFSSAKDGLIAFKATLSTDGQYTYTVTTEDSRYVNGDYHASAGLWYVQGRESTDTKYFNINLGSFSKCTIEYAYRNNNGNYRSSATDQGNISFSTIGTSSSNTTINGLQTSTVLYDSKEISSSSKAKLYVKVAIGFGITSFVQGDIWITKITMHK